MSVRFTASSSEEIKDHQGRQYHISTAPGEVAPYIMLFGDPARAEKAAGMFDEILFTNKNREYVTITGKKNGLLLTACATGIGTDNTEIAIVELTQCVNNPVFLRLGTCGALQQEINLGDFVISQAAMRFENTSLHYVPENYPAIADFELTQAITDVIKQQGENYHLGLTATASGFYAAQGRNAGLYKAKNPNFVKDLSDLNVLNMEMETSALFTLCSIKKIKAASLCLVVGNRITQQFIDPKLASEKEIKLIELGFGIFQHFDHQKI